MATSLRTSLVLANSRSALEAASAAAFVCSSTRPTVSLVKARFIIGSIWLGISAMLSEASTTTSLGGRVEGLDDAAELLGEVGESALELILVFAEALYDLLGRAHGPRRGRRASPPCDC